MMPEYLAAIDCGTNSFHLIIVRLLENGGFEIADREREVIRLGMSSNLDIKTIQPDAFTRAITTLKRFKLIAQSYNAHIRAIATSAVRESQNRDDFIDQVYAETGIEIEVVSGLEEARLIYTGILKAVPVYDKKTLCIDIGGGSTEFVIGIQGRMLYANSVKIGAVRLSQKFFPDYELTKSNIDECSAWVAGEIYPVVKDIRKIGFDTCIGTSGTIMSSALMIQAKRKGTTSSTAILNNFDFSDEEFQKILTKVLKNTSEDERKKIPGLDESRADIIPAGMLILHNILTRLKINTVTVSGYALREGIILDSISKIIPKDISGPNIREESVLQIGDKFNFDKEHSNHIANLALKLFDELKDLHRLNNSTKDYLKAAALLHDVGYHISHSKHHKHSYYIIRNAELLGFTERELEIIANTARYHRKSHPKPSHLEYNSLPEKDKTIVRYLAAILRIADSLDRTHNKLIVNLETQTLNDEVRLKLIYHKKYPEIEIWNLERRKGLFEEVFSKKLIIEAEEENLLNKM